MELKIVEGGRNMKEEVKATPDGRSSKLKGVFICNFRIRKISSFNNIIY